MSARPVCPRIGLSLSARATAEACSAYRPALEKHGCRVTCIRPGDPGPPAGELDGLLLSGGGDVHPSRYGGPQSGLCEGVDEARDELEFSLLNQARELGVPVLGICRGVQVLGVGLGGTLVQDIPSKAGARAHRNQCHLVHIVPGTRLHSILGCSELEVNSFHHQANHCLGPGVVRAAWADDDITEGIELPGEGFVLGVQWHPERMQDDLRQQRLFAAFVEAARERARRR